MHGEALNWGDLAKDYPGKARTKSFEEVFDWAAAQTDKYWVDPVEGTIHRILHEMD